MKRKKGRLMTIDVAKIGVLPETRETLLRTTER